MRHSRRAYDRIAELSTCCRCPGLSRNSARAVFCGELCVPPDNGRRPGRPALGPGWRGSVKNDPNKKEDGE